MRQTPFVLLTILLVACGDDTNKSDGGGGAGDGDVLDTNPNADVPGGGDSSGNHAPELERIGDRSVAVGQTLTITVSAKDSDNDKLSYSVFGNLPPGAR